MNGWTHPLSLDECEAWMREHRLNWKQIVHEAGLGDKQQYIVKSRWGDNPEQMAAVRDVLEKRERKKATDTGARITALEEWNRLGVVLANRPALFDGELARVRELAGHVQKLVDAARASAEAEAKLESVLGSVTAEPKKSRR